MSELMEAESTSMTEVKAPAWAKILKKLIWVKWESMQLGIGLLIILILGLLPIFVNSPYYLNLIILTVLYAYVGMAWNIAGGLAGQLLIGHATFFGLGAYTAIVLFERFGITPWIGIFVAIIPSTLLGLIYSFLTLRYGLKLDYFSLFTLAVLVVMGIIFSQMRFVGGAAGIWITFQGVSVERMIFANKVPYLYIALALLLIGLIITYVIYNSKMGKYMMAIREDDLAASCLGVNISRYKTLAVAITAAMEGLGGGVYVIYTTLIQPAQIFDLGTNVALITSPIIGGLGTIVGPILGALLNKPMVEFIRGTFTSIPAGSTLIIYGASLIIFTLFLPQGLAGLAHRLYLTLQNKFPQVQK